VTQRIFYFNEDTASVFVCARCEKVADGYRAKGGIGRCSCGREYVEFRAPIADVEAGKLVEVDQYGDPVHAEYLVEIPSLERLKDMFDGTGRLLEIINHVEGLPWYEHIEELAEIEDLDAFPLDALEHSGARLIGDVLKRRDINWYHA
jgi:hypothetical protein